MNQEAQPLHHIRQFSPPVTARPERAETPEETREELRQAIRGSKQVLATATTVFTIFPDTFTLDRAKLTVTHRHFFSTADVMSIRIEDVLNVEANFDPFFGSIKVISRIMGREQTHSIGNFWRHDAVRLKRVTQGYVIALQRNIDCDALQTAELAAMLDKLGEDDHDNV